MAIPMIEGDEQIVCASCGQLIGISDAYCPNCMTPSSEVSNLDPMLAIEEYAHEHFVGSVVQQQPQVVAYGFG